MFHVGGLNIQTLPALLAGAEIILQQKFDADEFFDALAQHRPIALHHKRDAALQQWMPRAHQLGPRTF